MGLLSGVLGCAADQTYYATFQKDLLKKIAFFFKTRFKLFSQNVISYYGTPLSPRDTDILCPFPVTCSLYVCNEMINCAELDPIFLHQSFM